MRFLGFKRLILSSGEIIKVPSNEIWEIKFSSGANDVMLDNNSRFRPPTSDSYFIYPSNGKISCRLSGDYVTAWIKRFSAENSAVLRFKAKESTSVPNEEVWLVPRSNIFYRTLYFDGDRNNNVSLGDAGYTGDVLVGGAKISHEADFDCFLIVFKSTNKKLGGK